MCSHIVCPHVHHAQACACTQNSESTRVIAVTALDVCGTLLRNLTLALSKARLNAAIRTTRLSFPSYILLTVSSFALILPVSTADCERGFSTLKRIKTDARNRLKTDTLDKLIRLSSEGPCMEQFNFDEAATRWSSQSNRRIKI